MWPLSAAIFWLCCAGCWSQNCDLTKTYFESRNFFSVIKWDPVDLPGQMALYSVQYNLYGSPSQPVPWCQNISAHVCDLTDVMMDVTTETMAKYHVKVFTGGRCVGQGTFTPFTETTLTGPQLSVTSNKTHLNVTVSPAPIPWNRSLEDITSRPSVKYIVNLTQPKSLAGKVYESSSRSVFIVLAETDVRYCGVVVCTLRYPFWPRNSENTSFCETVSEPNSWLHILVWPGLLALLLLLILTIMLFQMSVKRKHSLPKALILSKNNRTPFCSNPQDNISEMEVWSGIFGIEVDPQTSFGPQTSEIGVNKTAYGSQGSYRCQQDVPIQDSAGSSVSYSLILPVQMSTESSDDGRGEEPSTESSISLENTRSDADSINRTLVVPVRPAENGALLFHELLFPCDTDPISPAVAQEPECSTGEWTPLLTDLLQRDSRRSSSYLPAHVSDSVTSNYRQNWLPGISLEGQTDQRTYIMRTDQTEDATEPEDDSKDGDETRVGVIFLDKWIAEMEELCLSLN